MIVAGTGHRPPRLGLTYDATSRRKLHDFACSQLQRLADVTQVISGGAQGWDQALAHAAHTLSIPYVIAVPFSGQESRWPLDARCYYATLLEHAAETVVVSPGEYANWKYTRRDEWMVDHAQLILALLDDDQAPSGTRLTVEYATARGVPVNNVWGDWSGVVTS